MTVHMCCVVWVTHTWPSTNTEYRNGWRVNWSSTGASAPTRTVVVAEGDVAAIVRATHGSSMLADVAVMWQGGTWNLELGNAQNDFASFDLQCIFKTCILLRSYIYTRTT
jgi:hypothetical protein